jgi:hypothetical protein
VQRLSAEPSRCPAWLPWRDFWSKLIRFGHRFTYGTAQPVCVPVPNQSNVRLRSELVLRETAAVTTLMSRGLFNRTKIS